MRIRQFTRPAATALLGGTLLIAGAPARADDPEFDPGGIHIGQIGQQAAPAPRDRMPIEQEYAPHVDGRVSRMLGIAERLSETTVVQRGDGNVAASSTRGPNNVTGQFQVGSFNLSEIGVAGFNNKVVTMQNGNRNASELEIIGGNKTIYHFQIGDTQRVKEIYRGDNREKLLIIDAGRKGAYVARMK